MAVDPKIKEAIDDAVARNGQPKSLARKLNLWFEAVAIGSEGINDDPVRLQALFAEEQAGSAADSDEER